MTDEQLWQRHHLALKQRYDRYYRVGHPDSRSLKRLHLVDGWNLEQWRSSQEYQLSMRYKHNGTYEK